MYRVTIRLDVLLLAVCGVLLMYFSTSFECPQVVQKTPAVCDAPAAAAARPSASSPQAPSSDGTVASPTTGEASQPAPVEDVVMIAPPPADEAIPAQYRLFRKPGPPSDSMSDSDKKLADDLEGQIEKLMDLLGNQTTVFAEHKRYMLLREHFTRKVITRRRGSLLDKVRAPGYQFLRVDQKPSEAIYRVPSVPWDTKGLARVDVRRFGLVVSFDHIEAPTSLPATKHYPAEKNPLRVAVEMSGHMRTYRKCYESLVKNLLAPNNALLFAATYPDLGDKRFGIRVAEVDDEVPVDELAQFYGPYLAQVYMCDLPSVTKQLQGWFPTVFQLTQWSWMIYQLFMMELAHNTTLGYQQSGAKAFESSDPSLGQYVPPGKSGELKRWPTFDIVIRVRPDLFILGEAVVRSINPTTAWFNFTCGDRSFGEAFSNTQIIRAPHHPVYEWSRDPLSDHSAVGFTKPVTTFMRLFNGAKMLHPSDQEKVYFKHSNTAERMWTEHVDRNHLSIIRTIGWHVMIRNAKKFLNGTAVTAMTAQKAKWTEKIFGVTDPKQVDCPAADRSMERLLKCKFVKSKSGVTKKCNY